MVMNSTDQIKELSSNVQVLINTKVGLLKLQAQDSFAEMFALLLKRLLLALLFLLFMLFMSIGLAIYLCSIINSAYAGYLLVGGIYSMCFLFVLLDRFGFLESIFIQRIHGLFFTSLTKKYDQ